MNFTGVIVEESLDNKAVLKEVKILKTEVEAVTAEHQTPHIKQWTMQTVEIPADQAAAVAEKISKSLDAKHDWYADFKNDTHHYIIFRNKVFYIDRHRKEQYEAATKYGLSLGIPDYQVDFAPEVKGRER